jgi:hypothetical protein
MRRVARRRVLLVNVDPAEFSTRFWFCVDYLPGFVDLTSAYREPGVWERELRMMLGPLRIEPLPIPHDCVDGFFGAHWRRPEAFLDEKVRNGISVFAQVGPEQTERAISALQADLDSGAWQDRHGDLLDRDELDLGYKLAIAEYE